MSALTESIDIFPWDDRFATGIDVVDDQHKALVGLLNRLANEAALASTNEVVEQTFEELVAYAGYHFRTEESVWEAHLQEHPSVGAHRDSHAHFVQAVSQMRASYERASESAAAEELLGFLVRWLATHILESDLHMSYVVRGLEAGLTHEAAEEAAHVEMGRNRTTINLMLSVYDKLARNTLRLIRELVQRRVSDEQRTIAEDRFHSLFDHVDAAVYVQDTTGRFLSVNLGAELMYGYPRQWFIGKTPAALAGPDAPDVSEAFAAALRGEPRSFEFQGMRADGSLFPKEVQLSRALWADRTVVLAFARDISDRKRAETQLHRAASVFKLATESIAIVGVDGILVDVNDAFVARTGYARREVIGRRPTLLRSNRHPDGFYDEMWRTLRETGRWSGEVWQRRKDGVYVAEHTTMHALSDADGVVTGYVAFSVDITAFKEQQRKLAHLARHDALTDLPNRVALNERVEHALAVARVAERMVAIAYVDLDGFKTVNDLHGHVVGDRLLVTISRRMRGVLGEDDTLARIGGDEFVAVLTGLGSYRDSASTLDHLLQVAAEPVFTEGVECRLSASIGVAFWPQGEDVDADQLVRQAGQALYRAKQSGKNRYQLFDAAQDRELRGNLETQQRIAQAIRADELVLHYQPKVNMRTGELVGAEALVRWQHPERGLLAPFFFLPQIQGHPLIITLGRWVLKTALAQVAAWRRAGHRIPVSVNVDALELQQPDFVELIRQELEEHPELRRGDLELEILETSALEDVHHAASTIRALAKLGVAVSLDDFGTGYSSLANLKRLPVHTLKIDRGFVRDMLDDPDDLAILDGVVGLADTFQRHVLAEGVESREHGTVLLQLGCELAQGYHIARPMPAHKVVVWLERWEPDEEWGDIERVERVDIPLLFAAATHRATAEGFRKSFETGEVPPETIDPHHCRFGLWLERGGKHRFRSFPLLGELLESHEALHRLEEVLRLMVDADHTEQAAAYLAEYNRISSALQRIVTEMLKHGPG